MTMTTPQVRRRRAVQRWQRNPAAVAEVSMTLADGLRFTVDAADPTRLCSVTVADGSEVAALADVLGESGPAAWARFTEFGDDTGLAGATLRRSWVRRMVAESVRALRPTPVDETVLAIDEAAANAAINNPAGAARALAWVLDDLDAVADAVAEGALPEPLSVRLEESLRAASPAVSGRSNRLAIEEILGRMDGRTSIPGDDLDRWLETLTAGSDSTVATGLVAATHLGEAGADFGVQAFPVDLVALPARVLSWDGGNSQEIHVETPTDTGNADDVVATVYVSAADLDRAEGCLFAYAADTSAERMVAISLLEPTDAPVDEQGRVALSTTLRFTRPAPTNGVAPVVDYGVYHADFGAAACRIDPVGRQLTRIDRLMIDAWATYRQCVVEAELATLLDTPEFGERSERHRRDASRTTRAAKNLLEELADTVASIGDGRSSEMLRARASAVERFRDLLTRGGSADLRPLVSELLDPQWRQEF